jgi:BirA family biotin operon repressor/biotin-[acetyl-CoA-carboxylase] ligase
VGQGAATGGMTRFLVHRRDAVTSTMDEARELARAGAPDGTVVVARRQTAGRGRQGRAWFSPEGNLHATVLLRAALPSARLTEPGFVAAIAVADAVDAALGVPRARLKWPNDVLVDGAKVAGILVELLDDGDVLIGIGMNIRHVPDQVPYPATSLFALGAANDAESALARLLDALAAGLTRWRTEGFAATRRSWLARGPAPGEPLRLRLGQRDVEGPFAGLDSDGALLLADGAGTRRIVAGEVVSAR